MSCGSAVRNLTNAATKLSGKQLPRHVCMTFFLVRRRFDPLASPLAHAPFLCWLFVRRTRVMKGVTGYNHFFF